MTERLPLWLNTCRGRAFGLEDCRVNTPCRAESELEFAPAHRSGKGLWELCKPQRPLEGEEGGLMLQLLVEYAGHCSVGLKPSAKWPVAGRRENKD